MRHADGVLPMVAMARERQVRKVFVPAVDALEARLVEGVDVYPIENLRQLVDHFNGSAPIQPCQESLSLLEHTSNDDYGFDMAAVRGQEHVKRALEVSASGGHNILLSGPPGSGKTLLARSMPSILPRMQIEEALEVTKIYSVSGMLSSDVPLIRQRPFRAPIIQSVMLAWLVVGVCHDQAR